MVEHFRFTRQGKRRIHQTPGIEHVRACLPWVRAELHAVDPKLLVTLGATAAKSLLGSSFRLTHHRGELLEFDGLPLVATIHPSAVLRAPDEPGAGRSMLQLVAALFHFVVLGLLALISLIDVDTGLPIRDVVVKLGVLLLVLAAVHGLTITILMRIRDRRWQEQISDEITESHYSTGVPGATVKPVNDAENGGRQSSSPEVRW